MCKDRTTIVRGTTPTHTFTFDTNLWEAQAVEIIYSQNGNIVFSLDKDDLFISVDGLTASYTLTQEQTLMFTVTFEVSDVAYLQGRVKKADGTVVASDIIYLNIAPTLSGVVLEDE